MTKNEAREQRAAWNKALTEGRVVKYNGGLTMRAFLTISAARDFVESLNRVGLAGERIRPCDTLGGAR